MAFRWFWVWASMIRSPITRLYPTSAAPSAKSASPRCFRIWSARRANLAWSATVCVLKDATHILRGHQRRAPLGLGGPGARSASASGEALVPDWVARRSKPSWRTLRQTTREWSDDERLEPRLEQVRDMTIAFARQSSRTLAGQHRHGQPTAAVGTCRQRGGQAEAPIAVDGAQDRPDQRCR